MKSNNSSNNVYLIEFLISPETIEKNFPFNLCIYSSVYIYWDYYFNSS